MSDLEITMLIQKFAEENDLYSKEVRNLLSEGGVERLISQYKNISRRLDNISDENKALKRHIADLESKLEMHESECDPRNHSKELHYFAIAQNQFFRKENERLKNKNKILYDYIHGITGNTEGEIDKNITDKQSEMNKAVVDSLAQMETRFKKWSERRDSNPRHLPWQGNALPTELLSQKWWELQDSNL